MRRPFSHHKSRSNQTGLEYSALLDLRTIANNAVLDDNSEMNNSLIRNPIKNLLSQTHPSSTITPAMSTESLILVFGLTTEFGPIIEFFKDVFSATVAP